MGTCIFARLRSSGRLFENGHPTQQFFSQSLWFVHLPKLLPVGIHQLLGARSDVTLVPRYMWDLEDRGEPGSSLYFSPLSGRSPRSFSGVRFLFSDPKGVPFLYFCGLSLFNQISEALIVQSVLTGQRIYHRYAKFIPCCKVDLYLPCLLGSFGLKSGSYEVAPSLTRKFVCFFKGGKSSLGARPDNVHSAVQLSSEMEYKN